MSGKRVCAKGERGKLARALTVFLLCLYAAEFFRPRGTRSRPVKPAKRKDSPEPPPRPNVRRKLILVPTSQPPKKPLPKHGEPASQPPPQSRDPASGLRPPLVEIAPLPHAPSDEPYSAWDNPLSVAEPGLASLSMDMSPPTAIITPKQKAGMPAWPRHMRQMRAPAQFKRRATFPGSAEGIPEDADLQNPPGLVRCSSWPPKDLVSMGTAAGTAADPLAEVDLNKALSSVEGSAVSGAQMASWPHLPSPSRGHETTQASANSFPRRPALASPPVKNPYRPAPDAALTTTPGHSYCQPCSDAASPPRCFPAYCRPPDALLLKSPGEGYSGTPSAARASPACVKLSPGLHRISLGSASLPVSSPKEQSFLLASSLEPAASWVPEVWATPRCHATAYAGNPSPSTSVPQKEDVSPYLSCHTSGGMLELFPPVGSLGSPPIPLWVSPTAPARASFTGSSHGSEAVETRSLEGFGLVSGDVLQQRESVLPYMPLTLPARLYLSPPDLYSQGPIGGPAREQGVVRAGSLQLPNAIVEGMKEQEAKPGPERQISWLPDLPIFSQDSLDVICLGMSQPPTPEVCPVTPPLLACCIRSYLVSPLGAGQM